MEEAAEFHLCNGLTFAFSTVEREAIGFSIAGEKFEADPSERQTLQLVAAFALGCAVSLSGMQRKRDTVHLSPRQRDVLHCASDGLSVQETAVRLKISRNTADSHLRAVRTRFGVTSTVQAVAEGFRRGLIR
jgi:LuxR family quorum sensing-dependent transcriptional regulator